MKKQFGGKGNTFLFYSWWIKQEKLHRDGNWKQNASKRVV